MLLNVRTYQHGADFLAVTEREFQREEAINNVIYGIARLVAAFPQHQASPPYLATVQENDRLACAALMTPPHHLLLYAEAPAQAVLDLSDRQPAPERLARFRCHSARRTGAAVCGAMAAAHRMKPTA